MSKTHILAFLIAVILVLLPFYFRDELANLKSLGILGLFLINFFGNATVFLPAPAIMSVVAAGSIYNPLIVTLISSFGGTAGEMVGFVLGHSGKNLFYKKHHATFLIVKDMFHSFGAIIIFMIAFIPNPVFDLVGVFAGFVHYPLIRFFVLIFIARIIRNFLLASLGSVF